MSGFSADPIYSGLRNAKPTFPRYKREDLIKKTLSNLRTFYCKKHHIHIIYE